MLTASALQAHIDTVLRGDRSLDALADWLACASWNLHQHATPPLHQRVSAIGLCLMEYANGHRTEDEVRALLSLPMPSPPGPQWGSTLALSDLTMGTSTTNALHRVSA